MKRTAWITMALVAAAGWASACGSDVIPGAVVDAGTEHDAGSDGPTQSCWAADRVTLQAPADSFAPGAQPDWTLVSKPQGSSALPPSRDEAGQTQFQPDVPGSYTLLARGEHDGAVRERSLVLEAHEPRVVSLWRKLASEAGTGPSGWVLRAGGAFEGEAHDVSCGWQTNAVVNVENNYAQAMAGGFATWYGPPGSPLQLTFTEAQSIKDVDGSFTALFGTTADGRCSGEGAPRVVVPSANQHVGMPVYRADGQRLAYVRNYDKVEIALETVGHDGSNPRTVHTFSGGNPISGRPAFTTNGALVYLTGPRDRNLAEDKRWQLWRVADRANAAADTTPELLMTCNSGLLGQVVLLDDERALVFTEPVGGFAGLRVLRFDPPTPDRCTVERTVIDAYTELGKPTPRFALSPSRTQIALAITRADGDHVYVMPVDGSSEPRQVGGDGEPIQADSSPVWLGSDYLLAWSDGQRVISARADGKPLTAREAVHVVDTTSEAGTQLVTGTHGGCSAAPRGGQHATAWCLGLAGMLGLRRTLRRRARH